MAEPSDTTFWTIAGGIVAALGLGTFVGWYFQETLKLLLPSPLRSARWLGTRDIVPSERTHFTILIADLDGDDNRLSQTRHVEAGLRDQQGLEVVLVGPGPRPFERGSRAEHQIRARNEGRKLLARQNGDLLVWGEVAEAGKRVRLRFLPRDEGIEGTDGSYQFEAADLPRDFGQDFCAQLEALALASLAPATKQQGRYLADLLKRPAEKLERLLAKGAPGLDPDQVAGLQFALGNAASARGEQSAESDWLKKAVAAYEAALDATTRERAPGYRAMIKNNLGLALTKMGQMEGGTESLERAVATFEEAAAQWTRERVPLQWAGLQNNLGLALTMMGQRERGTRSLEKAIAAYRLALEEWTERVPLDRALAQNNLGYALATLGERQGDDAALEGAIDAYREALDLGSRESAPLVWAMSQNGLASAMAHLGRRNRDLEMLSQATGACHDALAVLSRDRMPLQWAHTQDTLGFVLVALGEHGSDALKLEEGVKAYQAALATYREVGAEFDIEDTKASLARAESLLAERRRSTTTP